MQSHKRLAKAYIGISIFIIFAVGNSFAADMRVENGEQMMLLQGKPLEIFMPLTTFCAIPLLLGSKEMSKAIEKKIPAPLDDVTNELIKILRDLQAQQCHMCM